MTSDSIDDGMIERMIGDLRTVDGSVGPDRVFTMKLERTLRVGFAGKAGSRGVGWPRMRRLIPAASLLTVLALVGGIALALSNDASNIEDPSLPVAVVQDATPDGEHSVWPSAEEVAKGCLVERRPEGSVEAMSAATETVPEFSMPTDQTGYPLFVQSSAFSISPPKGSDVIAIDEILANLFPCTVKDLAADLVTDQLGTEKLDNFYFANFSDDFMRRWFTYSLGLLAVPHSYSEPNLGRFLNGVPPKVVTAWDTGDGERQSVRAYVSYPNPPLDGTGWLVSFVKQDGVWKIDEYAWAVMDFAPTNVGWPTSGTAVTDVFLFDPNQSSLAENGASWPLPNGGPIYSGDGLALRLYNFSSVETRVVFADLNLDIAVPPGGNVTKLIDAAPGMYRMLVYQNGRASSEGPMYVTFLAPGTVYQGNG